MASCYFCAVPIRPGDGVRRRVLTSQSNRTYISNRPGFSYGQSYGLRTLCPACAAQMDQAQDGEGSRMLVSFIAAVIGWIWMVRLPEGGVLTGLFTLFLMFGGLGWVTYFLMKSMSASGGDDQCAHQDQIEDALMDHPASAAATVLPSPNKSLPPLGNTSGYSPDLKRVIQDLLDRMSETGISLGACYAVTDSAEDMKRLFDSWLIAFPVDHFPSEEAWCEVIYRQTIQRFFGALGQSYECLERVVLAGYSGDKIPTTLEPLVRLFPIKADESFSDYLDRLGYVIQRLSAVVFSEQPDAQS